MQSLFLITNSHIALETGFEAIVCYICEYASLISEYPEMLFVGENKKSEDYCLGGVAISAHLFSLMTFQCIPERYLMIHPIILQLFSAKLMLLSLNMGRIF